MKYEELVKLILDNCNEEYKDYLKSELEVEGFQQIDILYEVIGWNAKKYGFETKTLDDTFDYDDEYITVKKVTKIGKHHIMWKKYTMRENCDLADSFDMGNAEDLELEEVFPRTKYEVVTVYDTEMTEKEPLQNPIVIESETLNMLLEEIDTSDEKTYDYMINYVSDRTRKLQ